MNAYYILLHRPESTAERNILFQNAADSIFADDVIKPVACSKETLDEGIWCT